MSSIDSNVTLYHNPRCSKSRAALQLLQEHGIAAQVVEYLNNPPSRSELEALVHKLGIRAEDIVRKGEAVFKEKYAGRTLSEAQWLDALAADPILIERPIVIRGNKAVLGRPPQKVLDLF